MITGERGSGIIGLNGPAARLGHEGDIVHIITYAIVNDDEIKDFKPTVIILGKNNSID